MHKPKIEVGDRENRGAVVHVGRQVQITREELRELRELTLRMQSLIHHARPGWLAPYAHAHRAITRALHGAVQRAHES